MTRKYKIVGEPGDYKTIEKAAEAIKLINKGAER